VTDWGAFRRSAPALVEVADARIGEADLVLIGTLRGNGWPRISPVEPLVVGDELYLGMMWRSKKALDLLRDPRCVVHSVTVDKAGTDGDVKVYGRARDISDPEVRDRYGQALEVRIGWRPEGDFHLFAVDVVEVGYFAVEDGGHDVRTWRAP
jgi:pyridoxamine 5'-phosphate oxidase-like protein